MQKCKKDIKLLIDNKWKNHPWNNNGMVFQLSTFFLDKYRNKKSTNFTDLYSGEILHERLVWNDIKKNGMIEPLLIIIGYKNKTIRLESGNHRIKLAIEDGITHLPTAIFISSDGIINIKNGDHLYDAKNIVNFESLIKCNYLYQVNPIDVLIQKKYILID